ncbi:glycoside hydrolase family 5 protein [Clavibacter michiganensis subsp. insidiosus]|uniref:Endoglucanase n=1 Tax=Clavibacter michiganensis subsp. insidiosus TaxID=33014 RepID=A0A399R021_9MICO|nr:cellulase family glycosylhydrolase [Clavibacter michiganensis]OQJ59191.1 glycosyl hydrolase family 5 [Clavibacter michiganensis subsp. insidiosus]RII85260.1 glycoside hydrolase family 5 protein [Clavibacter michiganensis subsp. insidiosus]RIJ23237.1 glycoside hydrolase family 5 protein [Clavibacter michiganensis subsp. insidiosus]RMC83871.1 glycoside hydrolase family 5 protein [Clavibacter michiganensis subsp. insidiosus]
MKTRRGLTSALLGLLLPVALATAGASAASASAADPGSASAHPAAASTASTASGWLHTDGGRIVDSTGSTYTIRGAAWFGLESSGCVLHGLDKITLDSGMKHLHDMGFTTVRLPFSNDCLHASSVADWGTTANPDLKGISPLQLMDRAIVSAKANGLNVFLDQHRPTTNGQSELWYSNDLSESQWISDWKMLADRYEDDPTVIGVDLHNEPHGQASWGTGDMATDWRLAAERGGDAVLSVNPKLLVIVEGTEKQPDGSGTWWGGALGAAGDKPVELSVPNRVVYSPHDYPSSIYAQSWFSSPDYPNNLTSVWDTHWGYLAKKNIAPVLLGEFGTKLETTSDKQWLTTLVSYLQTTGISSSFWAFNPDSGDTGGLVESDWVTPEQAKLDAMAPILHPAQSSGSGSGSGSGAGSGSGSGSGSGTQPAPQPQPAPSTSGAVTATWQPGGSWSSGYVADLDVTAKSAVAGWTVSWASPGTTSVGNSLGMRCTAASGTVTCTGADWAGALSAGHTVHVGLQAGGGPAPASPQLTVTSR